MTKHDREFYVAAGGFTLVFVAILLVVVVVSAKLEADAFNRVTGKNVSWQDAVWLELRVDGNS